MIILGIAAEHNSSAALMINGEIKGLVQEERRTQHKNQVAFPLRAIRELVDLHLDSEAERIDKVVYGTIESDPYYAALDKYSNFDVADHLREMKELWYPHFYEGRENDGSYWHEQFLAEKNLNHHHNYDFTPLGNIAPDSRTEWFSKQERFEAVARHIDPSLSVESIDHHTCHAYYALYGNALSSNRHTGSLVLTADAFGDNANWSASTVNDDGTLKLVGKGMEHAVARIYKFVTLLLGMKPNEHEYKVMGLSSYSNSERHIKNAEAVFFDALDFRDGAFVSDKPLTDSYFDLRDRLEGYRFDNISAAVQNWSTELTRAWMQHWLQVTGCEGVCFSGGLSMNIKMNGLLLDIPELNWLSVPASGGDESLSAGACFAKQATSQQAIVPLSHVYLGSEPTFDDWHIRLDDTDLDTNDFVVIDNVDSTAVALLLAADEIVARCVGRAEFGARSLGNRTILANPSNPENLKKINDTIKNRDFWMPFTPSILEEYADRYIINPKSVSSPYMTIGFSTKPAAWVEIPAALHPADKSARPQFVSRETNEEYWMIIESFRQVTGIPAMLNTSLNLHGDPMNYEICDAVRTLALSKLELLSVPENRLICKKTAESRIRTLLTQA